MFLCNFCDKRVHGDMRIAHLRTHKIKGTKGYPVAPKLGEFFRREPPTKVVTVVNEVVRLAETLRSMPSADIECLVVLLASRDLHLKVRFSKVAPGALLGATGTRAAGLRTRVYGLSWESSDTAREPKG